MSEPRGGAGQGDHRLGAAQARRPAPLLAHDPPLGADRRLRSASCPASARTWRAWSSYAAAKRASREREQFGKGSIEGLMAAETGDNAAIPGALIPALALGIPGSAPAAVLMAAMIIHGAQPGPMLMVNQPQFIYDVVGITLVATLAILVFGLVMVRPILWVLRVPREIIMPIVFVLCVLGVYSITQRLFDVWVMLVSASSATCCAGAAFRSRPSCWDSCSATSSTSRCVAGWSCRTASLDAVLHAADQRRAGHRWWRHAARADPARPAAVFGRHDLRRGRHDHDRSTRALQRGARTLELRRPVRLCKPPGLSRAGGCALHAGRRPGDITDAQASRAGAAIAADHGLVICGLHWLLVAPTGLSISSPDAGGARAAPTT